MLYTVSVCLRANLRMCMRCSLQRAYANYMQCTCTKGCYMAIDVVTLTANIIAAEQYVEQMRVNLRAAQADERNAKAKLIKLCTQLAQAQRVTK